MVFTTFSGRCTHASLDPIRPALLLLLSLPMVSIVSTAKASSLAEFACGTMVMNGSFYSEAGVVQCDDPKQDIEVRSDSKKIFCFYSAQCTPVTRKLKAAVLKELDKSDWSKLTDDEINRTVIRLAASGSLTGLEITQTSVQCLGDKTSNGNPDCPKVNDCVNNRRGSSLYWKVKPLKVLAAPPTAADSDGFQVEQRGGSAPRGVSR